MPRNVSNSGESFSGEEMSAALRVEQLRGAPGSFWLVTGGWLWNCRWWEPFGESRRHYMHRSSSARISLSSKIAYISRRQNFTAYACARSSCTCLTNYSTFFTAAANAGTVPKNGRCNPPIFSCFEISANAPSASGREGVSGWNILRSRKTVPPGATRFLQTAGCEACPLSPLLRLCGRASGFFFSGVQAVAFQVAVQAGSPNPQELRGS